MHTYKAAPDVDVVTSTNAITGFGNLAINAFVIHADEPVLVDTGSVVQSDDFMAALRSVIDPVDLRWIWLTHTDFDHIGSLHRLLEQNERLRVVTSFLGFGIMGLGAPLPMDRVYLVDPGQAVDVGDRTLTAVRPPAFDNPITTGLRDERLLGRRLTPRGCTRWTGWRSPRNWTGSPRSWTASPGPNHDPEQSSAGRARFVAGAAAGCARGGPRRPPFVGPDQAALEQMLRLAGVAG